MARRHKLPAVASLIFWVIATGRAGETIRLSPHVTVYRDAVNGVCIEKDGRRLVVYGDPAGHLTQADRVLFTHGRRDAAEAGRRLVAAGAQAIVPAGEVEQFTKVEAFWEACFFSDEARSSFSIECCHSFWAKRSISLVLMADALWLSISFMIS